MTKLAIKGRNLTIRIFVSVLLISIYTIVTYQIVVDTADSKKLIQQIIRFSLTALLIYFVFKGKQWAVTVFTVLFSLGIIMSFVSLFSTAPLASKIPLIVMTIIYSLAVYHLNFAKSFKEYFAYLKAEI